MGPEHTEPRWGGHPLHFPHLNASTISSRDVMTDLAIRNGKQRRVRAMVVALLACLLVPFSSTAADGWTDDSASIVYAVATNADGSMVVAGRRDNNVVAYDASGEELWTFPTSGTVYGVAISDDGQRIASRVRRSPCLFAGWNWRRNLEIPGPTDVPECVDHRGRTNRGCRLRRSVRSRSSMQKAVLPGSTPEVTM